MEPTYTDLTGRDCLVRGEVRIEEESPVWLAALPLDSPSDTKWDWKEHDHSGEWDQYHSQTGCVNPAALVDVEPPAFLGESLPNSTAYLSYTDADLNLFNEDPLTQMIRGPREHVADLHMQQSLNGESESSTAAGRSTGEIQTFTIPATTVGTSDLSMAISTQTRRRRRRPSKASLRYARHDMKLKDLMAELASREIRVMSKVSPRRAPINALKSIVQDAITRVAVDIGNPEHWVVASDAKTAYRGKNKVNMSSVNWSFRRAYNQEEWDNARLIGHIRKSNQSWSSSL